MARVKRVVQKHWNYRRMFFLSFMAVMILGLFAYLFSSSILNNSKAARRLACVKSQDAQGNCVYVCQLKNKKTTTIPCKSAKPQAKPQREKRDPKENSSDGSDSSEDNTCDAACQKERQEAHDAAEAAYCAANPGEEGC